jgi:hypothetical protein
MKRRLRGNASERRMEETTEPETNCQSLREDKPEHHNAKRRDSPGSVLSHSSTELRFIFQKGIYQDRK